MTLTNPVATRIWMFLNKFRFSHEKAQRYELDSARNWISEKFPGVYMDWKNPSSDHSRFFMEWFDNKADWIKFVNFITNKNCLEIGSGPSGNIIYLGSAKSRSIIDPLIYDYRATQLDMFGKTWFTSDIALYPGIAEYKVSTLEGTIDGCIICRNTLDHCAEPMRVLENISKYALPGSYLLLWTDLYHIWGHDEGHHDVTRRREDFVRTINRLGFQIEHSFVKLGRGTVNFGCRARKI